jgi:hypothetical protein
MQTKYKMMKIFSILSRYTEKNLENIKKLPRNPKILKIFILLNGEDFLNFVKYANLVPINGDEIQNDENIFNLVPLNGEEFRKY